ncbi:MAG: hypothetical protein L0332_17665 [Chloroflexi bacterium]|nr:hypothetical protein [Chloroflexota bacterium]MCI0574919.1 hypothetical protein [Chloroflexota bacterium]MCI0644345.1 hypothetical protein [Chloroflexota bacterium]MCI0728529.1 hypothetical protein [Chloroflexota bacterium]
MNEKRKRPILAIISLTLLMVVNVIAWLLTTLLWLAEINSPEPPFFFPLQIFIFPFAFIAILITSVVGALLALLAEARNEPWERVRLAAYLVNIGSLPLYLVLFRYVWN